MKKKRFAVKFFSVMMVLCLMVGVSAACRPFIEHRVARGNTTFCESRTWMKGLPYSACRGSMNVVGVVVGARLGGGVAEGLAGVGVGEFGRALCDEYIKDEIVINVSYEESPTPSKDKKDKTDGDL
ncbi:MAG: hypothetical protein LBD19_02890 [Endomicrobium sp.]|nr:hypothetical protein [Endomicrobium sp.]